MRQCVTPEEAMPIREKLLASFDSGKSVSLDFQQIELVTTAFLNVLIGMLYEKYSSQELNKLLKFENLTGGIAIRIKKVAENAKLFYENREQFDEEVDNILYGDN